MMTDISSDESDACYLVTRPKPRRKGMKRFGIELWHAEKVFYITTPRGPKNFANPPGWRPYRWYDTEEARDDALQHLSRPQTNGYIHLLRPVNR